MASEQGRVPPQRYKVQCPYCEKVFEYDADDVQITVRKSVRSGGTTCRVLCAMCGRPIEVPFPEQA